MWEANPEMFHKAEEFISQTTDTGADDMDTSDTQWGWFYLAECGKWHMFQPDANIQCSVSSEDIEKSFKTNPYGSISFTTSKFSYKIDFAEMKQTNLTTGKQRLIKRAPFSITAFSYICENEAIPMPPHWENVNTEVPYQLISLHSQTHEYNEVASLFGKTMDRNRIERIQRIQNLDLWEFFCRKKAQLKKKRGIPQINEQMLFHGTSSEYVEAICIHNFDWRINGIHGALFGKGNIYGFHTKNCNLQHKWLKQALLQPSAFLVEEDGRCGFLLEFSGPDRACLSVLSLAVASTGEAWEVGQMLPIYREPARVNIERSGLFYLASTC
ncbi:PREDICTED: poly [ADP-ribose] polymerase 11 isoform X3 [Chinchilla lanigera]|uniref:poly [ADP-ribose] polymerase 11 isoform X3 n=1 Tax=Chinchilla lanigera TaxID=34839 RepID=UPI0006976D8C|nr:PREDICTED: poly [ADP-ribose] polymerase 11 isoform X3 [Chinchilla lanigera]